MTDGEKLKNSSKPPSHRGKLAQTARNAVKDMRIYYQYLFERLIPYVKEHGLDTEYSKSEEMDRFMGWSDAYIQYEAETLERERQLIIPLAQNI